MQSLCRLGRALVALVLCFGFQTWAHADGTWPATINIGIQKGDPLVALRASGELEKAFAPHGVTVKWNPAALRLLFDLLDRQTALELAHPTQTAQFLSQNTGVRLDIWSRALPRLEWGVHYPLTDEVIDAQQDSADLAYREHVIPRKIDVREAIVDIR